MPAPSINPDTNEDNLPIRQAIYQTTPLLPLPQQLISEYIGTHHTQLPPDISLGQLHKSLQLVSVRERRYQQGFCCTKAYHGASSLLKDQSSHFSDQRISSTLEHGTHSLNTFILFSLLDISWHRHSIIGQERYKAGLAAWDGAHVYENHLRTTLLCIVQQQQLAFQFIWL